MKYIISCRQPLEFQQKAKVMYVEWNDRKGLLKLGHDFPDTEFILFLPNEEIDIRELANYDVYCHHNLICRIFNDKQLELCKETEIKFYFGLPVSSYQQLRAVKENGAYLAHITAPLTHDLENVKKFGLKIMATMNSCMEMYPALPSNPSGAWFRPEDENTYAPYIDYGCFSYNELRQERGLFKLYTELKTWHGELKDLIIGLNYAGKNHLIPPSLAERRLNCRQTCMSNGSCHLCQTTLDLANPTLLKKRKSEETT